MSTNIIDKLDAVTGLWVVIGIGFAKHIEYTVTDILARWIDFSIFGVGLTVWLIYGLLWMAPLAFILLLKTLEGDN